ncbi:MAG: hypothetical protein AAGB46_03220 [Verrucomicrobiota bacterium]
MIRVARSIVVFLLLGLVGLASEDLRPSQDDPTKGLQLYLSVGRGNLIDRIQERPVILDLEIEASRSVYPEEPPVSSLEFVSVEWVQFFDALTGEAVEVEAVSLGGNGGSIEVPVTDGSAFLSFRVLSPLPEQSLLYAAMTSETMKLELSSSEVTVFTHALEELGDELKLEYLYDAGRAYFILEDADSVEEYAKKIKSLVPNDPGAWELEAEARALRGDMKTAYALMNRAIEAIKADPVKYPYEPTYYYLRLDAFADAR